MKFAVIGLSSFGINLAKVLYEQGMEVLAIDKQKGKIEEVKDFVSHAVTMDAAVKENLLALGIRDMDVVVVSMGPGMEESILTVLYLHEIGIARIVVKALSEDHAKILEAVGGHEVIFPEKDMGIKTALRLCNPNIMDYFPLISGIQIQEIAPSEKLIGKSLKELELRKKFGIQVLAIKEIISEKINFVPDADFVIKDSDILVVMGDEKSLSKLK